MRLKSAAGRINLGAEVAMKTVTKKTAKTKTGTAKGKPTHVKPVAKKSVRKQRPPRSSGRVGCPTRSWQVSIGPCTFGQG